MTINDNKTYIYIYIYVYIYIYIVASPRKMSFSVFMKVKKCNEKINIYKITPKNRQLVYNRKNPRF